MANVYKITNKINNKSYIGKTSNSTETRWKQHKELAQQGKGFLIHKAIRKYGVENFYIETVESDLSDEESAEMEIYYINKYDSFGNGYNLIIGGDGTTYKLITVEEINKIIEMYESGMTLDEIAKIAGCSRPTVSKRLKENGVNVTRNKNTLSHKQVLLFKNDTLYKSFPNLTECSEYLIKNGYTSGKIEGVKSSIRRVIKGERLTYLGFKIKVE